jgi:hypothetical protein
MVSRPGTTVWGEILDLSVIDIRCELTLEQVDRIEVGQTVEVRQTKKNGRSLTGKVEFVGIVVDKGTELIPVIVRVENTEAVLRCGEPVQIGFGVASKDK